MAARNLRVGLCAKHYPPDFSGQGFLLQQTVDLLGQYGVEVEVLSVRLADGARDPDPRVRRFLARGETFLHTLRRAVALRRHFGRSADRYDLVHSVMPGFDFTLNLGFLRGRGLPVLYEMSLLGANDPESILQCRFGRSRVEMLKRVEAWSGLSRGFLPSVKSVGFPEDRFHVVYGAVDLEAFQPADDQSKARLRRRLDLPVDARIAISVGSVIPRKGMDRVLHAWQATGPEPGRDLLLIVGPDTAADRLTSADLLHVAELRALADSPEVRATVRFLGRVENVAELMRASDVFVFLSRSEGLGLVIVEAMAAGLPCVVSPLDGIAAEMVIEGETGFIVEDADEPAHVAGILGRALTDRGLRLRLGAAGRRVAVERFSMQSRAEAMANLYYRLARRQAA